VLVISEIGLKLIRSFKKKKINQPAQEVPNDHVYLLNVGRALARNAEGVIAIPPHSSPLLSQQADGG
jgi:hypothetical protein